MKNKVIIIGSDHVNTLGLVRTFGENNIKPYLFLVNPSKNSFVLKSKYIEKYWVSDNENISIYKMIEEFSSEKIKPVVIPSSDQAAYLLDMMYDKLKEKFILPNVSDESGNIIKLMDKFAQFDLCKKFNIRMANSILLKMDFNSEELERITLPCIAKPLVSAKGNKDDIVICYSKNQLFEALNIFKKKKYCDVIIQDFIDYDFECDIVGFSFNNHCSIPGILKKNRIWPLKRGSTTYGTVLANTAFSKMINDLKNLMSSIDYNGIFDIEVFIKGEDFYLNEINFRNSAISYAYMDSYIPYYWYLSNVSHEFCDAPLVEKEYTFINDIADLHNVLDKNISFDFYKKNRRDSKICLSHNKFDNAPYYYMIFKIITEKLKISKFFDYSSKLLHKDDDEYILCSRGNEFSKDLFNDDYQVLELDEDNYGIICENNDDIKEFGCLLKSRKANGIALVKDDKIICRGFIKYKGAKDRFLNLKNENSFLISSVHVYPEFRGKHYQCDLIKELIFRYIKQIDKETKIYAVVYKYNIPSLKNFKKMSFSIYKEKSIYRFIGKSLNRENV